MRRLVIISTLITLLVAFESQAQSPGDSVTQKIADTWVQRLNNLDDWALTVDGKESPELAQGINSMMELFAPDVIAEVPPHDEEQIGPVMLRGIENVRKWVDRIATSQVRLNYIVKRQTGGPTGEFEGWRMVYSGPIPWGGTGLAFQIIGAWSLREDRRRFTAPGAVFMMLDNDGKIQRLRFFLAEIDQVVPL